LELHYDVDSRERSPRGAEGFPHPPLAPIAVNGARHRLSSGNDPQPRILETVRPSADNYRPPAQYLTARQHRLKLLGPQQALESGSAHLRKNTFELNSGGQPRPTLGPARAQYLAATKRLPACAISVRTLATRL